MNIPAGDGNVANLFLGRFKDLIIFSSAKNESYVQYCKHILLLLLFRFIAKFGCVTSTAD